MGDNDEFRVEPRTALVGRGISTTPERINDLQKQAAALDKLARAKPTREFSAVMAAAADGNSSDDEQLSEKEKRRRALPRKGPRPGLLHPAQRDTYGREDDEDEPVVIKG